MNRAFLNANNLHEIKIVMLHVTIFMFLRRINNTNILYFLIRSPIEGACTFPTTWDGTWYDSSLTAADVTFNKANLQVTSGWTITAYSSTVTTWTCVDHDSSSNLILFKYVLFFVFIHVGFRRTVHFCIILLYLLFMLQRWPTR